MDKIKIKDLEVFARHGVFPEENFLGQKFVISATLHTSTRKAGLTDELEYSIHYGEVSHLIKKIVEENTWKLLEKVAEELARAILLEYPLAQQADIKIKKPWAPVGLPMDTVSVEISRRLVIVGYLDKRQQHLVGSLGDAIDPGEIGWAGEDAAFLPETDDASGLPAF